MSQKDYSTKRREFKHLTKEKRAQIEILMKRKAPKAEIAREVGIARSTLYNELKRGTVAQLSSELKPYSKYFCDVGQRVYEEHRQNSRPALKVIKALDFVLYAEKRILQDRLSPDAICGRAKLEGLFENTVCTKTLYNYIGQGLLRVKNIDLPLRVKRNTKPQRSRNNRRRYGMSIEERAAEIAERKEFGHGEIDTIVGKKDSSAAILCLDERSTRGRFLQKISSRSQEGVKEGLEKIKKRCGKDLSKMFRSITSDNGSEFAALTELLPGTAIYYTHPYSAFERGTNEKQNSLVRRFFPKGTDFEAVSDEAIAFVENWINNLPRKIFNYRSSAEMLHAVLFDVAI